MWPFLASSWPKINGSNPNKITFCSFPKAVPLTALWRRHIIFTSDIVSTLFYVYSFLPQRDNFICQTFLGPTPTVTLLLCYQFGEELVRLESALFEKHPPTKKEKRATKSTAFALQIRLHHQRGWGASQESIDCHLPIETFHHCSDRFVQ